MGAGAISATPCSSLCQKVPADVLQSFRPAAPAELFPHPGAGSACKSISPAEVKISSRFISSARNSSAVASSLNRAEVLQITGELRRSPRVPIRRHQRRKSRSLLIILINFFLFAAGISSHLGPNEEMSASAISIT